MVKPHIKRICFGVEWRWGIYYKGYLHNRSKLLSVAIMTARCLQDGDGYG